MNMIKLDNKVIDYAQKNHLDIVVNLEICSSG